MPDQGANVLAKIGKYVRSRSRSPGGNTRSGGYGSPLGILTLEPSLIDQDQKVPKLFNTLIRHLRPHTATEGLFRVSPSARTLQTLKTKVEVDRLDGVDPHSLAFLLKAWLRELPQGLVPPPFQDRLLASSAIEDIKTAVIALPDLNKATLNALFEFLNTVAGESANKMDADALAIVLGPSLFRVQATIEGLQATNKTNEIAHKFIKQYATFREAFSSGRQNAEVMSLASREEFAGDVLLDVPISPKSPKNEHLSLHQVINDSVNQYLSLSGEENESLSDPASPRLKQMTRNGSASTSEDKLSNGEACVHHPPTSPSPLTPSPQPHERLNPPTRSAPRRGSRRRPSRNRTNQMHGHVIANQVPQSQQPARSNESLSKSSNSTSMGGVNHEPLDVFERLNDGPSLEGWRNEPTPSNSAAPTPSGTSLDSDRIFDGESHPASPSDPSPHSKVEQPKPLIPKLDFSSLAPNPPTSRSPTVPPPHAFVAAAITSENESQPEGDLTVVNTPRTSPDCEEAKNRLNRVSESSTVDLSNPKTRTSQPSRERRMKERKTKTLTHHHKKQSSVESTDNAAVTDDKKSRGRSRNRPLALDDHLAKLKNAVQELEDRMGERRGVARRLDGIEGMSELQLREEKAELQRELLIFESTYGRPQGGADRQAVRLIYHRYRELKRRLSKLDNRSAPDQEAFLREIESELSRIERERRELGRAIKNWEASFRMEHGRSPANGEKSENGDYTRYKHLRARRTFLQDLQQQKAPESFTV